MFEAKIKRYKEFFKLLSDMSISHRLTVGNFFSPYLTPAYPIWWSDMPQIMYTFFDTYDLKGKNIMPFCTHAGSGLSGTVGRIKKLEPQATVYQGLAIYRTDVTSSDSKVKSWIAQKAK